MKTLIFSTNFVRLAVASALCVGGTLWTDSLPAAYQTRRPTSSNNNAAHAAAKGAMDSAKKQFDEANKRLNELRPKHQQAEIEFKKEQREYQQAHIANSSPCKPRLLGVSERTNPHQPPSPRTKLKNASNSKRPAPAALADVGLLDHVDEFAGQVARPPIKIHKSKITEVP